MSQQTDKPLPDIDALFELFRAEDYMPEYQTVPGEEVPEPYNSLLVHEHHMTVTVEKYHGTLVDVRVLAEHQTGDTYSRKILLTRQTDGQVVMFGVVRIHFRYCSEKVRDEILQRKTPLGRILIQNDVLRRIEPTGFFQTNPGPDLMKWFDLATATPAYGRFALIHCDEQPAIELIEIVAPE
ncbi:MAG: hypothetical protein ACFCD0_24120 [Gemmataceae bacterium]